MRTVAKIAATLGVVGAIAVGSAAPAAAWYGYHHRYYHHHVYYPYYPRHYYAYYPYYHHLYPHHYCHHWHYRAVFSSLHPCGERATEVLSRKRVTHLSLLAVTFER